MITRSMRLILVALFFMCWLCMSLCQSLSSAQQYAISNNRVMVRTSGKSERTPVTGKLPFKVDDDAPMLVLPRGKSSQSHSSANASALDATILVSVRGGIYTSPDGGNRWMRTLTTSGRYQAKQFRTESEGRSVYLDVQRDGETGTHSWLSKNGGMSWVKAASNSVGKSASLKSGSVTPRQTQSLPFDITWSEPILLSDTGWSSFEPKITASNNDTIHVTWWNEGDGAHNMSYCRSMDGGVTFSAETEVFPGDTTGFRPYIMTNKNRVFLFFGNGQSDPIPNTDLHMLVSTDYGTTWSIRARIGPEHIIEPFHGGTNWGDTLAWLYPPSYVTDGSQRLLISSDNGATWTKRNGVFNYDARVSTAPSVLHMITNGGEYAHSDAAEALYLRSTNLGETWIDTTLLSVNDDWYSDIPVITSFQPRSGIEQAWVAWRDTKYGWENFLGASLLGRFSLSENHWIGEQLYSPIDEPNASEPRLAANDSLRALTCYLDLGDAYHAGVAWTGNGITQFAPLQDITPGVEVTSNPAIAVSRNAIHLVWEQRDPSPISHGFDRYHVWYRKGEVHFHNAMGSISTPTMTRLDSTPVHRTSSGTLTIRYEGVEDTLHVGSILSDNPHFAIAPAQANLIPINGDSIGVQLAFQSAEALEDTARIYIYHNGTSPSPAVVTVTGRAYWRTFSETFSPNMWQLVSVPLEPVYPVSFPSLFEFSGNGYQQSSSLVPTKGYWAKPEGGSYQFTGRWYSDTQGPLCDTIRVRKGWNLMGIATTDTVNTGALVEVPINNLSSVFYEYDGSRYVQATFLQPGKAYFIKIKNDGVLVTPHQ